MAASSREWRDLSPAGRSRTVLHTAVDPGGTIIVVFLAGGGGLLLLMHPAKTTNAGIIIRNNHKDSSQLHTPHISSTSYLRRDDPPRVSIAFPLETLSRDMRAQNRYADGLSRRRGVLKPVGGLGHSPVGATYRAASRWATHRQDFTKPISPAL
jgi:hypothetical protein